MSFMRSLVFLNILNKQTKQLTVLALYVMDKTCTFCFYEDAFHSTRFSPF